MSWTVFKAIQKELTDDLLKPGFTGHCYIASEAYYHIVGKEEGYRPHQMMVNSVSHWWLMRKDGDVIDPTATQFEFGVNYWSPKARCIGFLTKEPSKRAQTLIDRVNRRLELQC